MFIEARTIMPAGAMRPAVREAIERACAATGTPMHNAIGRNRRRTRSAAMARQIAIVSLYGKSCGGGRIYGLSEIGRALGIHHATVLYHLRKAGMK